MTIWGNLNTAPLRLDELRSSTGEMIGASVAQAVDDLPTVSLDRMIELADARADVTDPALRRATAEMAGGSPDIGSDAFRPATPSARIASTDAKRHVKEAGLDKELHLPDRDLSEREFGIMLSRAQQRYQRKQTIARGPDGFIPNAAAFGTSFLLQAIDPINVASAFIPVVGEARYARILADAGESLVKRAAARVLPGAAEGAVGAALVEPLIATAKLQEGADYTFGDFLTSIAFGAGLGSGLHVGFGGARDVYRARRGEAQYPFGPGEPLRAQEVERILQRMGPEGRPTPPDGAPSVRSSGVDQADLAGQGEIAQGRVPESVSADSRSDQLQAAGGAHSRGEAARPAAEEPIPSAIEVALADLPGPVKQDVLKAGIAAIGRGEPVRAGEMLEAAANGGDRRIGESLKLADDPPDPLVDPVAAEARKLGSPMEVALRWARDPEAAYRQIDELVMAVKRVEKELRAKYGVRRVEDLDDAPLTKKERDFIFYGDAVTDPAQLREIGSQLQPVDNLREAAREIAYEFGRLPKDPAKPSWMEQLALARLQVLFSEVERLGGNLNEVIKEAGGNYAARFNDLNDAEFMATDAAERLRALFTPSKPSAAPAAPLSAPINRDTEWQRLSESRAPFDEPEVREASAAADRVGEPKSLVKRERLAAAERAAAEAEELWKANEAHIPDDIKAKVDAELQALDLEVKDRTEVLKQGAACLAAAIA